MKNANIAVLKNLFQAANHHVPLRFITEKVMAHPDPDSIACLTDVLGSLKIGYKLIEANPDEFMQLKGLFIAEMVEREGMANFIVVNNPKKFLKKIPGFFKLWTGRVLILDFPLDVSDYVPDYYWKNWLNNLYFSFTVIVLAGLGIWVCSLSTWHIGAFPLVVPAAVGLFYGMFVNKQMANGFLTGDDNRQDTGLAFKAWQLVTANFGYIMLVYFCTQLLVLKAYGDTYGDVREIVAFGVLIGFGVLFSLCSIIAQLLAGKACLACNIGSLIVWVQGFIAWRKSLYLSFYYLPSGSWAGILVGLIFCAMVVSVVVILYRERFLDTSELIRARAEMMKFKDSTALMRGYLSSQKPIAVSALPYDLFTGAPDAPIQLVVTLAPFSARCSRVHDVVYGVLKMGKIPVGVLYRFTYSGQDERSMEAIHHIIGAAFQSHPDIIHQPTRLEIDGTLWRWYKNPNLDAFKKDYPERPQLDMEQYFEALTAWRRDAKIDSAPAIHINGLPLREPYTVENLPSIIKALASETAINSQTWITLPA